MKYLATNIALGLYNCVLFSDNLTRMTQYSYRSCSASTLPVRFQFHCTRR